MDTSQIATLIAAAIKIGLSVLGGIAFGAWQGHPQAGMFMFCVLAIVADR